MLRGMDHLDRSGRQTLGAPNRPDQYRSRMATTVSTYLMAQARNANASAPSTAAPADNTTAAATAAPMSPGAMPGWAIKLPDGTDLLLVLDMDSSGNVSSLFAIIPSLPYVVTGTAFNQ